MITRIMADSHEKDISNMHITRKDCATGVEIIAFISLNVEIQKYDH